MNRTDRLYALVEELRAADPRPVRVAALAARFEVSRRSIQRDLQALMEAGVPVRALPGRGGGWTVDSAMTLPPLRLTLEEASAVTVALAAVDPGAPYSSAARSALQKIMGTVQGPVSQAVRDLAARIVAQPSPVDPTVRDAVEHALAGPTVLRLRYTDAQGQESEREVEPAGLLTAQGRWYLIAWCRTRRAPRGFRIDRIVAARPTGEPAPPRELRALLDSAAETAIRPVALDALAPATPSAAPAGRPRRDPAGGGGRRGAAPAAAPGGAQPARPRATAEHWLPRAKDSETATSRSDRRGPPVT
ncbi:MAG TPA: YafY family protein [Kineosporiaceae bacterium]|nr:YafY family protein [Kineosporiaceae bacterium]